MKNLYVTVMLGATLASSAFAADHDPKVIGARLNEAKMSLVEGIEYAEKTSGAATSAKFEVDGGKLILSIYTIPEGLGVEPEKATLTEFGGEASDDLSKFSAKVFTDKEHIARSSVHMTLFQLSKLSLKQVIARALAAQPGTPIDVRNPLVRGGRPVADVVIIRNDQKVAVVTVDLLSGQSKLQK